MRAAVYWAPELGDPLTEAGNRWLGRDPEHGVLLPQPALSGLAEATEAARLYGFHATLRPPMRLATGWAEFCGAVEAVAADTAPFALPPLAVTNFSGFLALRETAACPALQALADACVRVTDPHRLPPSADELARRRRGGLSAEQEMLLQRWGYPHVMQSWFFHMTLSRRLDASEMAVLCPAAESHFAAALAARRRVTEIAICTQANESPPAPFLIAERLTLRGQAEAA